MNTTPPRRRRHRRHRRHRARSVPTLAGKILALTLAIGAAAPAHADDSDLERLSRMSLEELLAVEVETVGRKSEGLMDTAAAVHVITAEDIERSSATSLADVLRQVPGMHVARIGSRQWAVSARGFADLFANKLLVLVDGRTVYTPLFSGVLWEELDVLLPEIERIEVVRGPAGTTWGPNAVNGVVNIVTKDADATSGTVVRLGAGTGDQTGLVTARHGFRAGPGALRLSVRAATGDGFAASDAPLEEPDWQDLSVSLRGDWSLGRRDELSVHARAALQTTGAFRPGLSLEEPMNFLDRESAERRHVSAQVHWRRRLASGGSVDLRVGGTSNRREFGALNVNRERHDVSLVHRRPMGARHDLTWGLELWSIDEQYDYGPWVSGPESVHRIRGGLFVQADLGLSPTVSLDLGARIDVEEARGADIAPTIRVAWRPTDQFLAWGAVSRATRLKGRLDEGLRVGLELVPRGDGPPLLVETGGADRAAPETVLTWEGGIRYHASSNLSLDATAFVSFYDDVRTFERGELRPATPGTPYAVLPFEIDSRATARTRGLELGLTWSPSRRTRLDVAWTLLDVDMQFDPDSTDDRNVATGERGNTPGHRLHVRAHFDFDHGLGLDVDVDHAADWPEAHASTQPRLGLRLGWRPSDRFELSLRLQNVLEPGRREHSGQLGFTPLAPLPRSASLTATWRF